MATTFRMRAGAAGATVGGWHEECAAAEWEGAEPMSVACMVECSESSGWLWVKVSCMGGRV